MKKKIVIILSICGSLLIVFLACGKRKNNSEKQQEVVNSESTVVCSESTYPTDDPDTQITEVTTSNISTIKEKTPDITTSTTSTTSTAPKVTTKPQTTTTAPKVTTQPQTTTTAKPKPLIVPTQAQCAVIENEIMRLVNEYRVSLNLQPYGIESKLIQGARIRAEETSHTDCFGHTRPDGTAGISVLADVGYGGGGAGAENLGATNNLPVNQSNYFECSDAELKAVARYLFNAFKASPDHNKNMTNATLTKMGVGIFSQYETTLQGEKRVLFYSIQLFTLT